MEMDDDGFIIPVKGRGVFSMVVQEGFQASPNVSRGQAEDLLVRI
jgi:hypothetical protein